MPQRIRSGRAVMAAAVSVSVLTGCSSLNPFQSEPEYRNSRSLPPLEVPPDLTLPTRDDRYAVPDVNPRGTATFSAYNNERSGPRAPSNQVLTTVDSMRVERSGNQRWLVVRATPDTLWPQLRGFWQDNGFELKLDAPDIGVMETEWNENRAKLPQDGLRRLFGSAIEIFYSTSERDKFRTRIESGKDEGTVEVYISHRGVEEIYPTEAKDSTVWQPRPVDPELEAEMLRRLMVRLGADQERAKQQLATPSSPEKAKLAQAPDGGFSLSVEESFDRAWRRVGLALDRVGVVVEDRDRAQGVYYVRYLLPDEEVARNGKEGGDGWLASLAFWRSGPSRVEQGRGEYRVQVKGDANITVVRVLSKAGDIERGESARQILRLLQDQLK